MTRYDCGVLLTDCGVLLTENGRNHQKNNNFFDDSFRLPSKAPRSNRIHHMRITIQVLMIFKPSVHAIYIDGYIGSVIID